MLVISALLLLFIFILKELLSADGRLSRIANFLYIPALPLIVLFGIAAYERIREIPSLTG